MKDEEIKYLEGEIKELISQIEKTFYYEYQSYSDYSDEEYPGYTKSWLEGKIKDLYLLIRTYLEMRSLQMLLKDFLQQFETSINVETTNLIETAQFHPESEDELVIISSFKRYLLPFKGFEYEQKKEAESKKLTSVLEHTDHILKNVKTVVTNEADVYKQVKWVLNLYYPTARLTNKAGFIQGFKTYNPDILIPELKTAIEYKYIKDRKENIDNYLDQIRIDATNYTGDYRYENFIAVLYIRDTGIATAGAIRAAWQQKKFPPDWDLVIAMGS